MKNIVLAVLAMASTPALADGFVCQTVDGELNIRVFNHTQPELGTRNAAVMVLSDPSVSHGRKTIAKFTSATELLSNDGARYVADVDLRYADSSRKGEWIAGTKLGELAQIVLDVDFSYGEPVEDGELVKASLRLKKRNGQRIYRATECTRQLMN